MRIKEVDKIIDKIRTKRTPYTAKYLSLELQINECVYPPGEEALLLAKNLLRGQYSINLSEQVLDYGTGSGFLALIAAQKGAVVTATDINPHAIACAKHNFDRSKTSGLIHEPLIGHGFSTINYYQASILSSQACLMITLSPIIGLTILFMTLILQ